MEDKKKKPFRTRVDEAFAESPTAPISPAESRGDKPTPPARPPATAAPSVAATPSPAPAPKGPPAADSSPLRFDGARDAVVDAVFAEAMGPDGDGNPREALATAEAVADRLRLEGPKGSLTSAFHDLRSQQDFAYPNARRKVRMQGNAVVYRDPKTVTTICVHQTACEFGVSSAAIRAAGGDVEGARARRALDVACHALAFRHGYFVASHPLRAYVYHGNRFNAYSLGLEIEGRYAGLVDDPSTVAREDLRTTWGGKPTALDEVTTKAACAALQWLAEQGRAEGMPIEFVAPHRMSSDTRRSDPGQEIWQRVVLDFAVAKLGLTPLREKKWSEGYNVPTQWDPQGVGSY